MTELKKLKRTMKDIGQLVKALVGTTLMVSTVPIGLYCMIRDVNDRVIYFNDRHLYDSNKPSPNTIDFPSGDPDHRRIKHYEKFCTKYILNRFFK